MNTYTIETEHGPITAVGDHFGVLAGELDGESYGFQVTNNGDLAAFVSHRAFVSVGVTKG